MRYPHVAARIFNTPLLIHPDKLAAIVAGLGGRLLSEDAPAADSPGLFTSRRGQWQYDRENGTAFEVHQDIAVVNAMGVLAHRTRMNADSSMVLGYQQIVRDVTAAVNTDGIREVLLLLDSPGGEVAGAFEAASALRELSGKAPVTAMIDALAASAGYLLASAASTRVIAPTGSAGSIGVVMQHIDFSRALANDGIGVTHIYAGAHKIDGHPYAPLPESVRADFQAEIDELYSMFVATVAEYTQMSADAIRSTEARMYRSEAAVSIGLADRVGTADDTLSRLMAQRPVAVPVGQPARATVSTGALTMTDTQKPAGDSNQPAKIYTQADHDRAVAAAREEGAASARAEGVAAESERISTILALVDPGNALAVEAAHNSIKAGMSAEHAKVAIDVAVRAGEQFSAHKTQTLPSLATAGGHDLGPDGEHAGEPDAAAIAKQVLSVYHGTRQ